MTQLTPALKSGWGSEPYQVGLGLRGLCLHYEDLLVDDRGPEGCNRDATHFLIVSFQLLCSIYQPYILKSLCFLWVFFSSVWQICLLTTIDLVLMRSFQKSSYKRTKKETLHIHGRTLTALQIVKRVYNPITATLFVSPQKKTTKKQATIVNRVKRFNKDLMTDKVFGLSICGELGYKTKLPKRDEHRWLTLLNAGLQKKGVNRGRKCWLKHLRRHVRGT